MPMRVAILLEVITIAAATFALGGAATQTVLCAVCSFLAVALARIILEGRRKDAAHLARMELARDVHDVLAHALSALRIQLQLARHLAAKGVPIGATLELAERLAREGADEVQLAVASLRGDEIGPATFAGLIGRFRAASGFACEFDVDGIPRLLSPEKRLTLYRTVQEGLTNAVKHGAPPVSIKLHYASENVQLRIGNGRSGECEITNGYGLVGLRERAELVGAVLETQLDARHFSLLLTVPYEH